MSAYTPAIFVSSYLFANDSWNRVDGNIVLDRPVNLSYSFVDGTEGNDNSQLNEPPNLVGTGVVDRMRGSASCSRSRCNVRLRHRTAGLVIASWYVRGGYQTVVI